MTSKPVRTWMVAIAFASFAMSANSAQQEKPHATRNKATVCQRLVSPSSSTAASDERGTAQHPLIVEVPAVKDPATEKKEDDERRWKRAIDVATISALVLQ